jgi:hypothetical protein
MVPGNEQRVAREERPVVEERDRSRILEDQVSRLVTGDDLTEAAVRVLVGQVRDTVRGRGAGEES